jgi:hypothetical protein
VFTSCSLQVRASWVNCSLDSKRLLGIFIPQISKHHVMQNLISFARINDPFGTWVSVGLPPSAFGVAGTLFMTIELIYAPVVLPSSLAQISGIHFPND